MQHFKLLLNRIMALLMVLSLQKSELSHFLWSFCKTLLRFVFFFKSMYLGTVPTIIIMTFVQGFLVYRTLLQASNLLYLPVFNQHCLLKMRVGGWGGECSLNQDQHSSLSLKNQAWSDFVSKRNDMQTALSFKGLLSKNLFEIQCTWNTSFHKKNSDQAPKMAHKWSFYSHN